MQYWHFLMLPGLKFVSRYQLAFAILMFLGSPAWMLLLVLGTWGVARADRPSDFVSPGSGLAVLILVLITWFAPKIATSIDVMLAPGRCARRSAAAWRFLASVATETVFFVLLSPIMWFEHTVFLAALAVRRRRRLGRPVARRSCGAARPRAAQAVAADRARLGLDHHAGVDRARGDSGVAAGFRRARFRDPVVRPHREPADRTLR